jgi:hypothetical protein
MLFSPLRRGRQSRGRNIHTSPRETSAENEQQDRRTYSVRLTDAGKEKLRAISEVARTHHEAICFGLDQRSALHWPDRCNELRPPRTDAGGAPGL